MSLSSEARSALKQTGGAETITPHDFRHTAATVRVTQLKLAGLSDQEAFERLRAFFGWSHTSDMPRYYARAYYEDQMAEVWNQNFDAAVDGLRWLNRKRGP